MIEFSKEDKVLRNNDQFLYFDSAEKNKRDRDRILIWTHKTNIGRLQTSEEWAADGTFTTCPEIYRQFYSVHATSRPELPMIFALLPSKLATVYFKFWLECFRIVGIVPARIHIDFEVSARSGFLKASRVFSQANGKNLAIDLAFTIAKGCNAHFKNCIFRKNRAITKKFMRGRVYFFFYLSYMPHHCIKTIYETLKSNGEFDYIHKSFLEYFERVWINGDKKVWQYFAPEMWSIFEALTNEDGTMLTDTNALEGFHNGFRK